MGVLVSIIRWWEFLLKCHGEYFKVSVNVGISGSMWTWMFHCECKRFWVSVVWVFMGQCE